MNLIKNGDKYYLAKSGNNYYGIQGNYYTIVNGKLIWANPDIYIQHNAESNWTVPFSIDNIFHKNEDELSVTFKKISELGGNSNQGPLFGGTDGEWGFSLSRWWSGIDNKHGNGYTTADVKHTMTLKNYEIYLNGSSLNLPEGSHSGISNNPAKVSVFYSANGTLKGNIYNIIWKRNNNLIYYFVPVPKGLLIGNFVVPSNGMFDIVEQKFYENLGTGEFTIGGIPEDYIIEDGRLLWNNQDEYIQSTGTQYINTNFNANQDTRVKMRASTSTIGSNQSFFVGRNAAKVNTFAAWVLKNGSITIFRNDYNTTQTNTTLNITTNTIYNIDFNKNNFYVDDVLYSTSTYSQFQSTYPIILGASTRYTASDTNYGNYLQGKIYNCQIYNNEIITRYFVPVHTDLQIGSFIVPSNGMFDIVNQQFYSNQGTGNFTYGKDS